jgi:hypothetical protein
VWGMQVKAKDLHARSVQKAEAEACRIAAIENQRSLKEQMAEKLRRDYFGEIDMTKNEKEFMRTVLRQAEASVGKPHPIAVNKPW